MRGEAISLMLLLTIGGCASTEEREPQSPEGQARLAAERQIAAQAASGRLTHVLAFASAYYVESPAQSSKANGTLAAGTRVTLLEPNGAYALVRDESGQVYWLESANLRPLTSAEPATRPISGD